MITDEYDLDLQFVVDYLQGKSYWNQNLNELIAISFHLVALQVDSTLSTHALNHEVNSQKEIDDMFDNISYHKGGSLLRMIKMIIGEENFMKMLRVYVEEK